QQFRGVVDDVLRAHDGRQFGEKALGKGLGLAWSADGHSIPAPFRPDEKLPDARPPDYCWITAGLLPNCCRISPFGAMGSAWCGLIRLVRYVPVPADISCPGQQERCRKPVAGLSRGQ